MPLTHWYTMGGVTPMALASLEAPPRQVAAEEMGEELFMGMKLAQLTCFVNSPANFSCAYNKDMDRRALLRSLINDRYHASVAEFARAINKAPAQVHQWLSGNRALGNAGARDIEIRLNLAQGYFDHAHHKNDSQPIAPGPEYVSVERINLKVSAGVTGFAVEHLNGNGPPIFFRADWMKAEGLRADQLFALRVSGDSMEPNLWDGDLIVLNSAATTPRDGLVFVCNYEGEVIIKRLERDAGDWWLTSDNTRYKRKRCDEHALLIGQVIYKQSKHI